MNTVRKAFEKALSDYYERLELNHSPDFTGKVISTRFGEHFTYRDPYMNCALMGFEAARAEPIVLPKSFYVAIDWSDRKKTENMYKFSVIKSACEAQGYTIKE